MDAGEHREGVAVMAERNTPNWAKGRCEAAWRAYVAVQAAADEIVRRHVRSLSARDQHEIRMLATHGWCNGQNSETEIQRSALARGGVPELLKEFQPDVAAAIEKWGIPALSPTATLVRLPAGEAMARAQAIVNRCQRAIDAKMNEGFRESEAAQMAQVYWDNIQATGKGWR